MGSKICIKRHNKEKNSLKETTPPDGGWGWFVCVAAFLIQFTVLGTMNNFGILYVHLYEDFGRKAFQTSLIGSINYGMMFLNGPIAAALAAKYGCRLVSMIGSVIFSMGFLLSSFGGHIIILFFTYGVMMGLGASLCYFSSLVAVGQYFYKKLSLANGIISSGSGFGSLAMGPIMNTLLKMFGWRRTLRIIAGISGVIFISAILYRPINTIVITKRQKSNNAQTKSTCIDFTIFKNKAYIIWCSALAIFILGYFLPFVHLVKYAQNNGVSQDESAFLIGIASVGSTVGRLFFGPISDHPKVDRLMVYQLSIMCMGVSNTLLPLMKSHATIIIYCVVWGMFEGCYVALCAVLTADIVGRDKLSSGVGFLFAIKSIPLTGGPALAGWIYETSKSYDVAFYIAGAACILCCCILFLIPANLPESEEVDANNGKEITGNHSIRFTKKPDSLENNGNSEDSAYISLVPSTNNNKGTLENIQTNSNSNLHQRSRTSINKSTTSLSSRFLQLSMLKRAKSSEFGSMMSIPIIPNSGSYRSLQLKNPVEKTSVDHSFTTNLHHNEHGCHHSCASNVVKPTLVISDYEQNHLLPSSELEDMNFVSQLPGNET